jgi:hypothetical protein
VRLPPFIYLSEAQIASWLLTLPTCSNVRQETRWRLLLRPICWVRGHRHAFIRPLFPKDEPLHKRIVGCARCSSWLVEDVWVPRS